MTVTKDDLFYSENPMFVLSEEIAFSSYREPTVHTLDDITHEGLEYLNNLIKIGRIKNKVTQEKYISDRKTYERCNLAFAKVPNSIGVYEIIKNRENFDDYNYEKSTVYVDKNHVDDALKTKEKVAIFESSKHRILLASNFMIE
jgi:hypothetical protein